MKEGPSGNEFRTYLRISGILGKDPVLVYSSKGNAIVNFTMCHNVGVRGNPDSKAIWFNMTAFGERAEYIAENYSKGKVIHIYEAAPDQDIWTYQGKEMKRDKWKIWKVEGYDEDEVTEKGKGKKEEKLYEPRPFNPDDDIPY